MPIQFSRRHPFTGARYFGDGRYQTEPNWFVLRDRVTGVLYRISLDGSGVPAPPPPSGSSDTAQNRLSSSVNVASPWRALLPLPSATTTAHNLQHMAFMFSGIIEGAGGGGGGSVVAGSLVLTPISALARNDTLEDQMTISDDQNVFYNLYIASGVVQYERAHTFSRPAYIQSGHTLNIVKLIDGVITPVIV